MLAYVANWKSYNHGVKISCIQGSSGEYVLDNNKVENFLHKFCSSVA